MPFGEIGNKENDHHFAKKRQLVDEPRTTEVSFSVSTNAYRSSHLYLDGNGRGRASSDPTDEGDGERRTTSPRKSETFCTLPH